MITVPIHEGEARGRGQLSSDNPKVAIVQLIYTSYNTERELVSRKYSKTVVQG